MSADSDDFRAGSPIVARTVTTWLILSIGTFLPGVFFVVAPSMSSRGVPVTAEWAFGMRLLMGPICLVMFMLFIGACIPSRVSIDGAALHVRWLWRRVDIDHRTVQSVRIYDEPDQRFAGPRGVSVIHPGGEEVIRLADADERLRLCTVMTARRATC